MTDFPRPLWRRAVLLLLLGLLLPMQSSLAFARSLAMLTAPQSEPVIAQLSVNEFHPLPSMMRIIIHHRMSRLG